MHEKRKIITEVDKKNSIRFWVTVSLSAIVSIVLIKALLFDCYRVPSDDMKRVLMRGDFVLVWKSSADLPLHPGEVIVFKYPAEPSQYRFGRVLAFGGQTVKIDGKKLFVDNIPVYERRTVFFSDPNIKEDVTSLRDFLGPLRVPGNSYFILGDNRDNAIDSRNWGALPKEYVLGKPIFVYFSWKPIPGAPKIKGLFSLIGSFFFNLTHLLNRIGFDRFGRVVR